MKTLLYLFLILTSLNVSSKDKFKDKKVPDFLLKINSSIQEPMKMRDPFKKFQRKIQKAKRVGGGYLDKDNSYSNIKVNIPENLDGLLILGILLGKQRRAIAKLKGKGDSFIIKEGDTVSQDGAQVKAIVPGGVLIAEKIFNVYDQEEYIETIIPVTTQDGIVE